MACLCYFLLWIALAVSASAHLISQISGEWKTSDTWEIEVLFDAGFAVPELRDDAKAPAPERPWLVDLGEAGWAPLRKEAERYLRENLQVKSAGVSTTWNAEFIDFVKSPPDFPELLNDGAYFRIQILGEKPLVNGAQISWNRKAKPSFILKLPGKPTEYLTITPGNSRPLPIKNQEPIVLGYTSGFESFRQGFLHVLPKGSDHILFIMGLFFYHRAWRSLLSQSVAFTLAHTVTLGLAATGFVKISGRFIEPLIALSLVAIALENLRSHTHRNNSVRLAIVFGFGLIHGLGFAGALSSWLKPDAEFLTSLLSANLGVEVAQTTILATAWLLTIGWSDTVYYKRIHLVSCLGIAATGMVWTFLRIN
jgi:HupE / UreJ protein